MADRLPLPRLVVRSAVILLAGYASDPIEHEGNKLVVWQWPGRGGGFRNPELRLPLLEEPRYIGRKLLHYNEIETWTRRVYHSR